MKVWEAIFCLFFALSARADLYTPQPSNSPPASNASWSQQQSYCNSVCSSLVNSSGQILGLNGQVGWTIADDLWCANHGSQTDSLVPPSPVPGSPPPSGSCPVTLLAGDSNCTQAVAMLAHCDWHNGQLEQQCEAYEAAGQSNGSETMVIALDIAAAGTCGVACAAGAMSAGKVAPPPLVTACEVAGVGASATELIETLMAKSDMMSKAISAVGGGVGLYMSGAPLLGIGNGASGAGTTSATASAGTPAAQGSAAQSSTGSATTPQKSAKRNNSCMSALLFAAMTGMRFYDMSQANTTQQTACSQVEQLASTASTIGNGGIPIPGTLAEGSTGAVSGSTTGAIDTAQSGLRCVASGGGG